MFLPGKSHGQRNLVGYSPWDHKELDMTEGLTFSPFSFFFHKVILINRVYTCLLVTKSCLTLCDSMDCSLPGSSVHRISQARTLEWVSIYFSKGSSQPRDWTCSYCISSQVLLPLSHLGSPYIISDVTSFHPQNNLYGKYYYFTCVQMRRLRSREMPSIT